MSIISTCPHVQMWTPHGPPQGQDPIWLSQKLKENKYTCCVKFNTYSTHTSQLDFQPRNWKEKIFGYFLPWPQRKSGHGHVATQLEGHSLIILFNRQEQTCPSPAEGR